MEWLWPTYPNLRIFLMNDKKIASSENRRRAVRPGGNLVRTMRVRAVVVPAVVLLRGETTTAFVAGQPASLAKSPFAAPLSTPRISHPLAAPLPRRRNTDRRSVERRRRRTTTTALFSGAALGKIGMAAYTGSITISLPSLQTLVLKARMLCLLVAAKLKLALVSFTAVGAATAATTATTTTTTATTTDDDRRRREEA